MSWTPKDPSTIEYFKFDFSPSLAADDTIQGIVSCLVASGDSSLIVSDDTLASANTAVIFTGAGGTDKTTYEIECVVDTVKGERLVILGVLLVRANLK